MKPVAVRTWSSRNYSPGEDSMIIRKVARVALG